MFGIEVTISASSDRSLSCWRRRRCRLSRLLAGAWDIQSVEPLFERGNGALGMAVRGIRFVIVLYRDRFRRRRLVRLSGGGRSFEELLLQALERQPVGRLGPPLRDNPA